MSDGNTANGNDMLPFDPGMCMAQFADTLGFVTQMQGTETVDGACAEAERRCVELFDGFYKSDDRTAYLVMLGYLAMDIAANVSFTLDRARLAWEVDG